MVVDTKPAETVIGVVCFLGARPRAINDCNQPADQITTESTTPTQATHLEMIELITPTTNNDDGDDDNEQAAAQPLTNQTIPDVCGRDKEARILLRPLGEIESAGYCGSGSTGVLATAISVSQSSSGSDSDGDASASVKNSTRHQPQPSLASLAKVIVGQEPDRASPDVCLSVVRSQQPLQDEQQQPGEQNQTKHGNQTNQSDRSKGGPIIIDPLGGRDGTSSVAAMSLSTGCSLDKANQGIEQIISAAEFKFRMKAKSFGESIDSEENCSESPASSVNISNSMGGESAASITSLTSGDEDDDDQGSETMTGSEVASTIRSRNDSLAGLWSPSAAMAEKSTSHEVNTMRIIRSLHEQRRELQIMDRQLSGLIVSHLSSIGRGGWYDAPRSSFETSIVDHDTHAASNYGFDNQVIDLTTSGSRKLNFYEDGTQHESAQQMIDSAPTVVDGDHAGAAKRAPMTQTTEHISTSTASRSAAAGNLGQFSSVNLRKSRLLSATVEMQEAITLTKACDQPATLSRGGDQLDSRALPHQEHHLQRVPGAGCAGGGDESVSSQAVIALKRPLITAPELEAADFDCSPDLTHDIQKLKRLRLSGHLANSSSGAFRSNHKPHSPSPTATNCNTIQSTEAPTTGTTAQETTTTTRTETNVDLLRDFMLHNQYLPSHLVLECLSQCQKQTSTSSSASSLSSILLPSAMSLIDASSSYSSAAPSSTARNQTAAGGELGDNSALMDCRQQIDHLDLVAAHHQHNLHQRGIEFSSYYAQHGQHNASAPPSAVSDQTADQRLLPEHQQTALARSRAYELATSHLDHNQLLFASHHTNNNNGNNNRSSRPPGDDYRLALPMTRHPNGAKNNNNDTMQLHTSQETLELIRATMGKGHLDHHHHHHHHNHHHQLQLQPQLQHQQPNHHQHLISMADIQRVAFKCHVCGSGFEDRHRLQQHLSIHLNLQSSWFEEKTITETMAQYESKRGDYLCSICDIRFETTAEFDKHMQAHGDKPHRCDLCSQDNKLVSFRYYRQLLTHLRSHCFLYSCRFAPDCKQTSNRKDYLKLHILKHHLNNQLPKQYTICCH